MEALIAMKWANGFVCPRCSHSQYNRLDSRRIPLFECRKCAHQTSPLVGTIFEGTHLPLMKWFHTMELFLLPDGITAMRLSQIIRVTYKTAWLMLHKIRHTLGEFNARELLRGEVKVNCDRYGGDPSRCNQFPHPNALAVVAGCTVTESGELEQLRIDLVSQRKGEESSATRRKLVAFINGHVDTHASVMQTFPLAFRSYTPLRKVVREAWGSLKRTYVALGPRYLQAYLDEYTGRRQLDRLGAREVQHQQLLRMCLAIPTIYYKTLIARQPHLPLAAAA